MNVNFPFRPTTPPPRKIKLIPQNSPSQKPYGINRQNAVQFSQNKLTGQEKSNWLTDNNAMIREKLRNAGKALVDNIVDNIKDI